jgi:hypothetical protein
MTCLCVGVSVLHLFSISFDHSISPILLHLSFDMIIVNYPVLHIVVIEIAAVADTVVDDVVATLVVIGAGAGMLVAGDR